MQRIVFFTDSPGPVPTLHFAALREAVAAREDFELVGVVTGNPEVLRSPLWRAARDRARAWLAGRLDPERRRAQPLPRPPDYRALGRCEGFTVLEPPGGDPNQADFVDRLAKELRPTVALSCFCFRRFRAPLLGVFGQAVNYHDGELPGYRGSHATAWSIYRGERESGWAFHRMTESLDEGPVLISGRVAIGDSESPADLSLRKAREAAGHLPDLLEAIADARTGRAQEGEAHEFRMRDARALCHVDAPGELTRDELGRRLRAFGTLHLHIDGASHPVTKLERARPGTRLAFTTSDGATLRPTRFRGLPLGAHRLRARLRGRGSRA